LTVDSAQELKDHPFFTDVDWQQVYQQKYPPPLIPPRGEVNAADAFDIGSFDEEDTKGIKVGSRHASLLINLTWDSCFLWPPCVADADIIFLPYDFFLSFMVALCNRETIYTGCGIKKQPPKKNSISRKPCNLNS